MSGEQASASYLERTRAVFAAAAARDVDGVMSNFRPSSVWDVMRWGLGYHTGLSQIQRSLEDWLCPLDEYAVAFEEMRDLGSGVVLAVCVQRARPAGSRARLLLRYAPVFIWADGWAERVTHYRDVEEARTAARLAVRDRSGRGSSLSRPGWEAVYQA